MKSGEDILSKILDHSSECLHGNHICPSMKTLKVFSNIDINAYL